MTVLQRRTLRSRQRRQSLSTASWWVLRPDSNPICSPHHDLVRKQPQGAAPLFCSGARLWSQLLIWIRAPAFRSTTNVSSEFSSSTELHLGSFYLPKDSLGPNPFWCPGFTGPQPRSLATGIPQSLPNQPLSDSPAACPLVAHPAVRACLTDHGPFKAQKSRAPLFCNHTLSKIENITSAWRRGFNMG